MSDQRLRLYLCGHLAIEYGATIITEREFPARQGRLLWAYLTLHRKRPVGREDLAEALWGDDIPDRWDSTINGIVSRLRALLRQRAIPPVTLQLAGDVGRYTLRMSPSTIIDWERARAAIHATDTLMRQRDYGAALAEARVALEIAARGFLIGESAPWIEGQRRAMVAMQLHALEATIEAELGRGQPALAEREAHELLQLDPLRENGYRLLMRALAAGGNRAQVQRVMEDCRSTLHIQAGIPPDPVTEKLFHTLMGDTHGSMP
ncbi:MAG TPA: BTAD domain-containing putative transcriptional regulator [Thermomicrobiales bacterium]|jgi:DNA-binding SARP family transcriptional activator